MRAIRKETLENLVLKTVLQAFATPQNVSQFADDVLTLLQKQNNDHSVLNLLKSDLTKVEKSISNLLDCMEQGISTESTKKRLEDLEQKRNLLTEQILIEKSKHKSLLTEDDVIKYVCSALRKNPKQLFDLLIKEIRLYNDKIEIDLHFTDKKNPDDENRWGFCFYSCEESYSVDTHVFHTAPTAFFVQMQLFV